MVVCVFRSHDCGELRKEDIGKHVMLAGWIKKMRSFGKLVFVDLRDRYGVTQLVFDTNKEVLSSISELKKESVIKVEGNVKSRADGQSNREMPTGEIEIDVDSLEILSSCEPLPIDLDNIETVSEENRLKYRYLDLRIPEKQNKLIFRSNVTQSIRNYLKKRSFVEIDTPYLMKSTPEGARDFLVPSRVQQGKFFALPQSPQIYKQILMVSGLDKYFQIARCFRDEDLRADRQLEFTQLDLEMSFAHQEDVWELMEGLFKTVFKENLGIDLKIPFERLTYDESMRRFGTDKPDLRFSMELKDITDLVSNCDFKVFSSAKMVKGICVPKQFSRKEIDKLTDMVKQRNAKGLAYLKFNDGKLDGPISKFLSEDLLISLKEKFSDDLVDGSTVFFVADEKNVVNNSLSDLRNHFGNVLGLKDPKNFKFCWITDFPLFEWDDDVEDYVPAHHMFTMPKPETVDFLESDKSKVYANCYDIVLNGVELASGSERIHDRNLQKRVMKAMNISEKEAEAKFGFLLEAFRFGAPPHAGIAPGLDRLVAIMQGTNDIREVIAFPRNKNTDCPMDGSPDLVDENQLEELGISLKKV